MIKVFLVTVLLTTTGHKINREIDMGSYSDYNESWTVCKMMANRLNIMPAEPPYAVTASYCEKRRVND